LLFLCGLFYYHFVLSSPPYCSLFVSLLLFAISDFSVQCQYLIIYFCWDSFIIRRILISSLSLLWWLCFLTKVDLLQRRSLHWSWQWFPALTIFLATLDPFYNLNRRLQSMTVPNLIIFGQSFLDFSSVLLLQCQTIFIFLSEEMQTYSMARSINHPGVVVASP
jgi:hypothetical protein